MGKCIKNIALSVMAAIFGALALSGPVFATPNTTETPNTTDTTVVTPVDTPENPTDAPATTAPTDDTTEDATIDESQTCYDQVGNLGWLVCPGTGLLSKIIDGAYGLLTQVIQVNPIPTDHESPYYVVWEYFKNITNLIFVVFFLVVIFSQLTGVGINNYGIKKVLPRIIITAILVNLSYIVCTIAVDLSNILGNSLHGFFMHVQDIAVQNGTISAEAKSTSVAAITYAILGIGAAGAAGTALVFAGSIEGLLWMLAPVLLSGVIAVLSALIIMAARQALIYLLVMVSPLAFVAYMLPNTESWFTKWYKLFARMILFYPMFSVLYGASQLAGLVIIASSDNPFVKILGIAVEVVPLFMSIPLMKMSGTALNKIDGIFNRMTSPLTGAAAGYAASQGALAKQKALSKQNPTAPHTRLAQYLDKRRARRESDTAYLNTLRNENNQRYAEDTMYSGKGDNKYLNRRGRARYENEKRRLENATAHKEWLADLDEGFANDDKRIRAKDRGWVSNLNKGYVSAVDRDAIIKARQSRITLDNERQRADRLHSALAEHADNHALNEDDLRIRKEVSKAFRIENADDFYSALNKERAELKKPESERRELTAAEKKILHANKQKLNVVLADSISARRKADAADKSSYLELYADSPAGPSNEHNLVHAIETDNYNSMSAALEIMAQRGDYGDIDRVLRENSSKLVGDKHLYTQKVLNDTLIKMKADDPYLWAYAKNNMIRRSIHTSTGGLEGFIDYSTFLENQIQAGDTKDDFDKVSFSHILEGLKDGKLFASADRTAFKGVLRSIQAGVVPKDKDGNPVILVEPVKYARSSLCSGNMDGEALESYNNLFTLGCNAKNAEEYAKFLTTKAGATYQRYEAEVQQNLESFFRDMSASQLATAKTATLLQFNNAMNAKDGWQAGTYEEVNIGTDEKPNIVMLNTRLKGLLTDKIDDLNRNNMAGTRSSMNPAVRQLFNIMGREEK
ncbi:hypothetical protein IK110_03045 [Candidatus Saccharibacteria bacterium]|nr:hypothetical protein [Candidatus Saccharibacteria bacterium]